MFKRVTDAERSRKEQAINAELVQKNVELEAALLELAQIISDNAEVKDGTVVLQ